MKTVVNNKIKKVKICLMVIIILLAIFSVWHFSHSSKNKIVQNFPNRPVGVISQSEDDNNKLATVVKSQAEVMAQAQVDRDYATVVQYTYPGVISVVGGESKLIGILNESTSTRYKLIAVSFGGVSNIVMAGSELQATIPQTIVTRVDDGNLHGRLVSQSGLIAFSSDKGKDWTFIDASGKSLDMIKAIAPNVSSQLSIPGTSRPVFYRDY